MPIKNDNKKHVIDLIYIEGPGDIVEAFTQWKNQEDVITETSITFSSQVFDFCRAHYLNAMYISTNQEKKSIRYQGAIAENIPKKNFSGRFGYPISQLVYGLRIWGVILMHRPKYLHVTSGVTYWFMLAPLKIFGIKIYPQFHNTLWAKGFPPTGIKDKILLKFDSWFLKHIASATICCSPEIRRQIDEISNTTCLNLQFRAQFYRQNFQNPPPPPAHDKRPFTIVFAGRIEENKGVFDILTIAEHMLDEDVSFHICGGGPALEALQLENKRRQLEHRIKIHGKLKRPELLTIYNQGHAVIVPTRSDFCEGLPLVAIEAVLLGRPIITSQLCNALDVLAGAIIEAQPNDVASYVAAIQKLMSDKALYEKACLACQPLREQFLDGSQGLTNVLVKTLN